MTSRFSRALMGAAAAAFLASGALAQTPQPRPATAAPAPAAPAVPAGPKTYARADLVESARKFETQLRRTQKPSAKPVAQLRKEAEAALAKGDARTAADLYGQLVVAAPGDYGLWLRLGRSLTQIKPNQDEDSYTFLDRAGAAGFIAYRRATTRAEEADALFFLAHLYSERSLWRAALDTQKLALDLRDVPAERAWYDKLRAEKGFRVYDYSVDSDSANPRVCVQFSEDLAPGKVDFAAFVSVVGQDKPAVTVEDSQLCVEGLKHGERYDITVRAGLPSVVPAEKLQKATDISVYVRDRNPAVRFTGRTYVLPRTGPRGIPVVSVNTNLVAVELFRIGDRSLIPSALDGDFRRSLDGYDRQKLIDGRAEKVFEGKLETLSTLNAEVVTSFPVDEAIGTLQPGVYVLTAAPTGGLQETEDYEARATQWFVVSDLGLTALSGSDGLHVLVRGLGSAKPLGDVEVRLLANSNEVLASTKTDAEGRAGFDAALTRGKEGLAPAVIVAKSAEGDYAFLSLRDQAFDLTDRGVGGRAAPTGFDAFVTPERGVYRTGETVHVTALLRDPQARAAPGVPLTIVLRRPDGVEDRRVFANDAGAGGRAVDLPIAEGSMRGTWRLAAYVDPKGDAVGEATFLVEDYVPERLALELSAGAPEIGAAAPVTVTAAGRWLFGPPAAGLYIEGETELRVASERPGFAGWRFGRPDDGFTNVLTPLADSPVTAADGKAALKIALPPLPATQRPLQLDVVVRLAEGGGRAVERTLTLPVAATGNGIGVRPLFKGRDLAEGANAAFEAIMVDPKGARIANGDVKWELFRVERRYQWYRMDGAWDYEPVTTTRKVADGTLALGTDQPGRIEAPVQWGRYRLEVTAGGVSTAVPFEAGWGGDATAETPDRLEVALDKPGYNPGDTLTVNLASRAAGSATVLIVGDGVLASKTLDIPAGDSKVTFEVTEKWGPGAYALALMHRPLDVAAGRNPGRAIGLAWFSVDRAARTLGVKLEPPAQIRPETTLSVPVTLAGLSAGDEAYVTLALVDVGILNLTGFEAPDPDDHYLGQRMLATELRDLYGQLIDGMAGTRGRLRSGGDAGEGGMKAEPPTQPPLALFSGVVKVGADGKATIDFAVPPFDGTGRLMAVAWSANRVGHAQADVTIRDPVVITATLPRFLAAGDRSTLRLDLTNVDGEAGDYSLDLVGEGPVGFGTAPKTVTLATGARQSVIVPLDGKGLGDSRISVRVAGPGGLAIRRDYNLRVRPAYPEIIRRSVRTLNPGESLTLSDDLFADLVPGTGMVAVLAAPPSAIDVPGLLLALDRYPYSCSEQLTSRSLPMLYLSELASQAQVDLGTKPAERINETIARVVSRQGSDGSFGLWGEGGSDLWLDAYVTDFLTRAREAGYKVPDLTFSQALDRLRNGVAISSQNDGPTSNADAYAVYVLARNGRAPLGDLRYVADAKLEDVATPFARGQIAAALAMLGDKGRAERVFKAALDQLPATMERDTLGRADFGSMLRDAAGVATLAAEAGFPNTALTARERAATAAALQSRTSTQEDAWMLLAARAAGVASGMGLTVDGQPHEGVYKRTFDRTALTTNPIVLTNQGQTPIDVTVSIDGSPVAPEPAASKGLSIKRSYFTLDGKPFDPVKVTQNQRLVVVLDAEEDEAAPTRLLLVDHLPAGFEIDNPNLVSGGDTGALAWLEDVTEVDHAEFRDDRFVAAVDLTQDAEEAGSLRVAYIVRAVSPGRYAHPPATIEDMYRPDRFGRTAAGAMEVTGAAR
ncbi:alpha-2-macroglobulin family protein [Ancylobacter terrae]|uniref:alpha-2-macroglobulin family protein n=1 Tax=Ancylobacter sp. sgz301288 TaxID=3342077 RepID=UPI003859F5AE